MTPYAVPRQSCTLGSGNSGLLGRAALIIGVHRRKGDEGKARVTISKRDLQVPRPHQTLLVSVLSLVFQRLATFVLCGHPNLRGTRQHQNCQRRAADSFQDLVFHLFSSLFLDFNLNLLIAVDGCHNHKTEF